MITFTIRTKIIKNNNLVYFAIKNIVMLHEEYNFAVNVNNTSKHKNNIQTIIKNKKYEIIFPINFLIFFVFCILIKLFLLERVNIVFQKLSQIILMLLISHF